MAVVAFPERRGVMVVASLIATLALTACGERPRPPVTEQAAGDIAETWEPEQLTSVRDVPVDGVRAVILADLDSVRISPITDETMAHAKRLYARYGGGPLWYKSKGLDRERAGFLLRALANSAEDALDLSAYPLTALAEAVNAAERNDRPTAAQLARADLLLTMAYVALGEDLLTGQVNPRTVSQSWHIDPQEERVDSALARTLRSEPLDRAINTMRPMGEDYGYLRAALVRYRVLAASGGWEPVPEGKLIRPGQGESPVRLAALRARLAAEGILDSSSAAPVVSADTGRAPAPTSRYDRALAGAVAEYQTRHGIPVDSMLGAETVASMNAPVSYRLSQIAANLERYRWLPRSLGERYIQVNVPAFRLQAFDEGKPTLEMKVIVGMEYQGRATPVFSDTMAFVVFRPYWNVPDGIAEKEIWPKANADPGYFAANNYETFTEHGKTHVRQRPGDKNALGLVKFMFPNDFNIYLHDTPNDNLFDKDVRAFSHGCIRLEKPGALAEWVLGWPQDRVDAALRGANNRTVNLERRIPVYITYFTTYAAGDTLRFGNDLYDRDEPLTRAITGGAMPSDAAVNAAAALRKIADEWTR